MPTRYPDVCENFRILVKKFVFDISISGCRTSERDLSAIPTWCPDQCENIFVFRSKNFSLISRFLDVAQVKGICQLYQRGALISVRAFSFFVQKIFLRYLDFWRSHR